MSGTHANHRQRRNSWPLTDPQSRRARRVYVAVLLIALVLVAALALLVTS